MNRLHLVTMRIAIEAKDRYQAIEKLKDYMQTESFSLNDFDIFANALPTVVKAPERNFNFYGEKNA